MSTTKNTKENRKVVRAEYSTPESVFEIPDGLDLEDESIVEWWGVKWNTLHIKYVGKEEVKSIKPSRDGDGDFELWKRPELCEIEDAEDVGYEYEEDEDTCKSCNESVGEKNICDRCNECCDPSRPSRCCDCEHCEEEEEEEEEECEEEEVSLKKKIGSWLSDRDNHEGDLIDFLCDECRVEISSPPSDDEE